MRGEKNKDETRNRKKWKGTNTIKRKGKIGWENGGEGEGRLWKDLIPKLNLT